jgi:hypothetical protein
MDSSVALAMASDKGLALRQRDTGLVVHPAGLLVVAGAMTKSLCRCLTAFYSLLFIELITAPSSAHGRHCPKPSLLIQPEASRSGPSSEIPGPEACARWRARVNMEHSFHQ